MPESSATKSILASALKQLMEKQPFTKISVSDICESCGLNRKSFYYHFKDKYDLLTWIFYIDFIEEINDMTDFNVWRVVSELCAYFYRERAFYVKVLKIRGQNSVREYIIDIMVPLMSVIFDEDDKYVKNFLMFISDAFLNYIEKWLEEEEPDKPEVFADSLHRLVMQVAKKTMKYEKELK